MNYDNNLRGAIFPNDKQTDTQPDYKGSVEVEGKQYWVSAWKKTSKAGKPFMSLSLTPKDAPKQTQDTVAQVDDSPIDLGSIPF